MISFDRETPEARPVETADMRRRLEAATLWSAIRADRAARDERTARLRTMRLTVSVDA